MPHLELQYPSEPYSTVKRYKARGNYSLKTIHSIVNSCPILHVSFATPDSAFPAILPMIGQMGAFARPSADIDEVLDLYLHGYVSARIVSLARAADAAGGLAISVAASHVDGLVLSLTPNSHSYNYRSAVLFGHARLVDEAAEKLYAMELVTNGVVAGRWSATRVPPTDAELASTGVLRVRIASGSAKIRCGGPHDAKDDLANARVCTDVWTGVVPVYQTLGEPVPGPYNQLEAVPGYLATHVRDANRDAKAMAAEAVIEPVATKSEE